LIAAKERAVIEKGEFWRMGVRRRYRQLLLNKVVVREYIKRGCQALREGSVGVFL
jgi:hypothetical protein